MDGQYCRQLSDQGKRAIVCTAVMENKQTNWPESVGYKRRRIWSRIFCATPLQTSGSPFSFFHSFILDKDVTIPAQVAIVNGIFGGNQKPFPRPDSHFPATWDAAKCPRTCL